MAKTSGGSKPTRKAKPKPKPDPGYTVGKWRTRTQWSCNRCAFDTLISEEIIKAHVAVHIRNETPVKRG